MYVLLRRDPSRSENLAQDRPNEPATSVFLGFQSIIGAYEQKVVLHMHHEMRKMIHILNIRWKLIQMCV